MQTIRKSEDGNAIIVKRANGFAVSVRQSRWATDVSFRGTEVVEWHCVGKDLLWEQAEALFNAYMPAQAA